MDPMNTDDEWLGKILKKMLFTRNHFRHPSVIRILFTLFYYLIDCLLLNYFKVRISDNYQPRMPLEMHVQKQSVVNQRPSATIVWNPGNGNYHGDTSRHPIQNEFPLMHNSSHRKNLFC